jgi:signal transduction histidine kinase
MPSAEALSDAFFTHNPEALLVLDADLFIVAANLAAQEMLDLEGEGAGRPFTEFCTVCSGGRERCLLVAALDGETARCEPDSGCGAGDSFTTPVKITADPFEVDGTKLLAVAIHERSESEAAKELQRRERQLYEGLFDLTPIPLREEDFSSVGRWFARLRRAGVTDLDDYIHSRPGELMDAILDIRTIRVNRAMLELMGAEDPADLESFSRDEMTDEVLDSFRHEFITLWKGGTLHRAEFVGLDLHGNPFECLLTLSAQASDGELDLSRVVVALQDVTQVRAYQRTLENLIAGKDRFVASISHELRTPLATVLGLSQELFDLWDDFDSREARELMGLIALGANDLATLVEDLMLAAQIEVGDGVQSTSEEFELGPVIDRAVEECVTAGDLTMRPAIEESDVRCYADPRRVGQIVRNLVSNAARYGGGKVDIILGADPLPTVRVCDDGPGIPASEWERIFSPHEQTATDGTRGALGLGLAISRQLAEVMHGSLSYSYTKGTSAFTLTLPAGPEDRAQR